MARSMDEISRILFAYISPPVQRLFQAACLTIFPKI